MSLIRFAMLNKISTPIFFLLLLMVAVVRTNYGLWNADIPLGDEQRYIQSAYEIFQKGTLSSNLYLDVYVLAFRNLTTDPIIAHYFVRFVASALSVIGLFLFLSSLNRVTRVGAFCLALLWNLNLLNTPLIQYSNVSLFAFALACFGGYLWGLTLGTKGKLISLGILLLVTVIRPEYALLIILLVFKQGMAFCKMLRTEWGRTNKRHLLFAVIAVVFFAVLMLVLSSSFRSQVGQLFAYLDGYLFLGLKQCYSAFVVKSSSGPLLEPMTEFGLIMNEKFPGANGFLAAVLVNPVELLRYFILNGLSNLFRLVYILPNHSVLLPSGLATIGIAAAKKLGCYYVLWAEQLLIFFFIFAGNFLFYYRIILSERNRIWSGNHFVFVLSLAAVSVVPMLLLIPDPRYWIMVIPLLFWGPAAIISEFTKDLNSKNILCVAVSLVFVINNPVFSSTMNYTTNRNKDVVMLLRENINMSGNSGIKAIGFWPDPLLTFTIPGRWKATSNTEANNDHFYEEMVTSKKYDLVIVDTNLRKTRQFSKEQLFFSRLLNNPASFDYQLLVNAQAVDGQVLIYGRKKIGSIS